MTIDDIRQQWGGSAARLALSLAELDAEQATAIVETARQIRTSQQLLVWGERAVLNAIQAAQIEIKKEKKSS